MAVRSNKRALIIPPPCRVAESVDVYGFMEAKMGTAVIGGHALKSCSVFLFDR